MDNTFDLLSHPDADCPVAWWQNHFVTRDEYLRHIEHVAHRLPEAEYAINMCDNRYLFIVAFAAVLVKGQTNLLPPNRAKAVVEDVAVDYPNSYCLTDRLIADLEIHQHTLTLPDHDTGKPMEIPAVAKRHIAAIAFTSGSTGRPSPNMKTWGALVHGGHLAQRRFGAPGLRSRAGSTTCIPVDAAAKDGANGLASIIATVPPQHMYGLETTVMLPLVAGSPLNADRVFYPEDIRMALATMPAPRILITTPVHLRACVEAEIAWPDLDLIISATAPLGVRLAQQAEARLNTRVMEIYGFTEAGSIASRRTVEGDYWTLYDGFNIRNSEAGAWISGAYLSLALPLSDIIEMADDGRFKLVGRSSDMINIAGKRASLADLNRKLLDIEGVRDGVFYKPDEDDETSKTTRLVAFVVAPQLSKKQIIDQLTDKLDPLFLPRPLLKVNSLPRTESSKLPRKNLMEFYQSMRPV